MTKGIIMTLIGALFLGLSIFNGVKAGFQYEKQYQSYWELADKSSTIVKKAEYIDKFVYALEKSGLQGSYDAIIYPTPTNSFDNNLMTLKTLQQRLHEIEKMNVSSFEYQTAIQQITGQELGEAAPMLGVFHGCWYKKNWFLLWNWICVVQVIFSAVIFVWGIIIWINNSDIFLI